MFIPFESEIQNTDLPNRFTFPFYYDVHPLAKRAVDLLQQRLKTEDFSHDFGIGRQQRAGAIGKMFGVLVVADPKGILGYLAAFSGKLGNSNDHEGFVPPVFDLLEAQGFFRKEEIEINTITLEMEALEETLQIRDLERNLIHEKQHWEEKITQNLQNNQRAKALRAEQRAKLVPGTDEYAALSKILDQQSMHESRALKEIKKKAQLEIANTKVKLDQAKAQIENLRQRRAALYLF